jgi:hypothetical protein
MPGLSLASLKSNYYAAGWAGAALGTRIAGGAMKMSGANLATIGGAAAGGLYGGWDGAAAGAAMGRYGFAGARALSRNVGSRAQMNRAASGWMGFGAVGAGMAGRAAFRQLRRDGLAAGRFIGGARAKANNGLNSFKALHR